MARRQHEQMAGRASRAAPPGWSTASFGDATDTSPQELSLLGEHLQLCQGLQGRLFAARCRAEALHVFLAARIVTTALALSTLALGLIAWFG